MISSSSLSSIGRLRASCTSVSSRSRSAYRRRLSGFSSVSKLVEEWSSSTSEAGRKVVWPPRPDAETAGVTDRASVDSTEITLPEILI